MLTASGTASICDEMQYRLSIASNATNIHDRKTCPLKLTLSLLETLHERATNRVGYDPIPRCHHRLHSATSVPSTVTLSDVRVMDERKNRLLSANDQTFRVKLPYLISVLANDATRGHHRYSSQHPEVAKFSTAAHFERTKLTILHRSRPSATLSAETSRHHPPAA